MRTPGEIYDTGTGTVGGRGQQAVEPYPEPQHILTMTVVSTHRHEDHFVSASEGLQQRAERLKESGTPFTRDGMTLSYTNRSGAHITLTYEDPS